MSRQCLMPFVVLTIIPMLLLFDIFDMKIASAQLFRQRPFRRGPVMPDDTPAYRVGTPPRIPNGPLFPNGSLVQGDGRILQRVQGIVNLFTDTGKELKPVAVISLASFEEFKRTVQLVARNIRQNRQSNEEPVVLNSFLALYEKIVNQGFDTRQPLGMILQTDGTLYYPMLFTPINLDSPFGRSMQSGYAEQLPDGRYVLRKEIFNWPFGPLYIRQHNGWVFIASESQINALPDDPTVLLQGLDREHLIAARFDLQNVPRLTTSAALTFGEMQAAAQAETELEKASARLIIGYIRSLAEQSDFLEYTLSYDEENGEYVLRQKEIVRPKTERARLMQSRGKATSPFHAFYHPEGAILASHLVMSLTQSQREHLETILDETIGKQLLTEEERQEFRAAKSSEKRSVRERRRTRQAEAEKTVGTSPPISSETGDHRDLLAALLSQGSKPESGEGTAVAGNAQLDFPRESVSESMPDFVLSEFPKEPLDDRRKLEVFLRRVGACYYWALVGAVRAGTFDGASTCSQDLGILAVYNIVESERFQQAFDAVFAELAEQYPDLYDKIVEKDYADYHDFRFTKISFELADLFGDAPWKDWVPIRYDPAQKTTIVLAVRNDAVCFAVGQGDLPEKRLASAIEGTEKTVPVDDLFFTFSAYELGRAFSLAGDPDRFVLLKMLAADTNPNANAYAYSEFTDTTKTLTLRINALLTPSIWILREKMRDLRFQRFGY